MQDIKNHHRRFIAELIELYKSFPTLWNVKSSEYNDRDAKRAAYTQLIQKLREVEPEAEKQDVIRKINSLRSAFRREYRKMVLMKSIGKSYKPRLWYFNLIKFTADENIHVQDATESDERNVDVESFSMDNTEPHKEEDMFVEEFNELNTTPAIVKSNIAGPSKFKTHQSGQDEYDAVGYNVASKLRNMERNQRIIAERIIAETLFQGQMGALTINSSCSNFYPTIPLQNSDNEDIKFNPSPSV